MEWEWSEMGGEDIKKFYKVFNLTYTYTYSYHWKITQKKKLIRAIKISVMIGETQNFIQYLVQENSLDPQSRGLHLHKPLPKDLHPISS